MRIRPTWLGVGHVVAPLILLAASVAFMAGGLQRGAGFASVVFVVLGIVGIVAFGTAMVIATGRLLIRRPVLELGPGGVRRPAGWPRSRAADRVLPWSEVTALCLVSRGVPTRKRGVLDYLIFLTDDAAAANVRNAERPQLIALTMSDLPAGAEVAPWRFAAEASWDTSLKEIASVVRRHKVPILDRRKK